MATPDDREQLRDARAARRGEAAVQDEELLTRLSPEAEGIRAARPDILPAVCEILAAGWRSYAFSPAEIQAWLLAGFEPDREWYAAALRHEGVTPAMLTRFYRHRGTRVQEQLINVVLDFLHDQRNAAALTHLLDRWGVERTGARRGLRAG